MIYNRLIVAAIGFIRLEPYDGKLSRTVLRGGKDSNALLLPDYASVEMLYHPEYAGKPLAVGQHHKLKIRYYTFILSC